MASIKVSSMVTPEPLIASQSKGIMFFIMKIFPLKVLQALTNPLRTAAFIFWLYLS